MEKLVIFCPSLNVGGLERVVSNFCNWLIQNKKIEIHLVLLSRSTKRFYPLNSEVRVHQMSSSRLHRIKFLYLLQLLFFVRSVVTKLRPLACYSFGEGWNLIVLASLVFNKQKVLVFDRSAPNKKYGFWQEKLQEHLYTMAEYIIVQTHHAVECYSSRYNNQIVSIANPVKFLHSNTNKKKESRILLTVGRLIESKNIDTIIEVFANLKIDDWNLVIIGSEPSNHGYAS